VFEEFGSLVGWSFSSSPWEIYCPDFAPTVCYLPCSIVERNLFALILEEIEFILGGIFHPANGLEESKETSFLSG